MPASNPQLARRMAAGVVLLMIASPAGAGEPTVVEGTVTGQVTWQGEVHIVGAVTLTQAQVTVQPGSVIRLLEKNGFGGQLIIGSAYDDAVSLTLAGTADQPIEVAAPPDATLGSVEMRVSRQARLIGRHVRFARLKGARMIAEDLLADAGVKLEGTQRPVRPALRVHLRGKDSQLVLEHCELRQCGPVHVAFLGSDAEFQIAHCLFTEEIEPVALQLTGVGGGAKPVRGNRLTAGVSVNTGGVVLEDNVLIGEHAAVIVGRQLDGVVIRGNYLHNTADVADGRYCLNVRSPDAAVIDNVLRGGTYTLEQAPARLEGNVLVAADQLRLPRSAVVISKSKVPTHGLVNAVPADAVVKRNIFVGPAWSMLRTGQGSERLTIAQNTFDGLGHARRALHFNHLGLRADCQADVRNNCFLRLGEGPIYDEAHQPGTIAFCDGNAYAPRPESRFENVVLPDAQDNRRWLLHDVLAESPAALGLPNLPESVELLSAERQLAAGQGSPADVLAAWRQYYRPAAGSPLLNAGTPTPAGPPGIGAVEVSE